jgi:hypothetical protein
MLVMFFSQIILKQRYEETYKIPKQIYKNNLTNLKYITKVEFWTISHNFTNY